MLKKNGMEMYSALIIGILLPLLGTMLGASFVFFMKKEIPDKLQKALLGFASGVMVAASVWSLLIPSIDMSGENVVPAAVGFMAGIAFLLLIDIMTPHLHLGSQKAEGPRSRLPRTAMLALAVTIHNLPEGMAVGVVFAGASHGLTLSAALAVSIGIAIQNIPEGAIISMPMHAEGNSRWKSFSIGTLSGIVEPIGSIAILMLADVLGLAIPYLLAFAAGAMMYVVVEELIPETAQGQHTNLSTIGFAVGFVLMMAMDVLLG
jgi:ZIP family zinc transporter